MNTALVILTAVVSLSPVVSHAAPENWLERPPASVGNWFNWEKLPKGSFFEIPVSRLRTAESYLSAASYRREKLEAIDYLGGRGFSCPASTDPYLVRALYMQGGTGGFQLYWQAGILIVEHAGLGQVVPMSGSALVVCLPSEPTAIYGAVSVAQ